jgi:hypothetical protein
MGALPVELRGSNAAGTPRFPKQGEGFWVAQGGERLSWEARRTLGHFAGIGNPARENGLLCQTRFPKTTPKERKLALLGANSSIYVLFQEISMISPSNQDQ